MGKMEAGLMGQMEAGLIGKMQDFTAKCYDELFPTFFKSNLPISAAHLFGCVTISLPFHSVKKIPEVLQGERRICYNLNTKLMDFYEI